MGKGGFFQKSKNNQRLETRKTKKSNYSEPEGNPFLKALTKQHFLHPVSEILPGFNKGSRTAVIDHETI